MESIRWEDGSAHESAGSEEAFSNRASGLSCAAYEAYIDWSHVAGISGLDARFACGSVDGVAGEEMMLSL